jgi:hypothetical protein
MFTRNQDTFKISYLFKNDEEKNLCTWTTISIYDNKLQKNCSKIHSYEKVFFDKKDMQFFFSSNLVGSLYPIHTFMSMEVDKDPKPFSEIFEKFKLEL